MGATCNFSVSLERYSGMGDSDSTAEDCEGRPCVAGGVNGGVQNVSVASTIISGEPKPPMRCPWQGGKGGITVC